MSSINLLRLQGVPIFDQLALEEALFRADTSNWCLINEGSPPAIVMGLSQQIESVVHCDTARQHGLPLIRRFTGGGTVVVDEDTLFFTLICQANELPCLFYPESIQQWAFDLVRPAFLPHNVTLQGEDVSLCARKIGGTAQSLAKGRFVHHVSFLWAWNNDRMNSLLHPPKEPEWRNKRPHNEFLGSLRDHFSSKETLLNCFEEVLSPVFSVHRSTLDDVAEIQKRPHRKTLTYSSYLS